MTTAPIYLTEADVGRLVTVKDAIAVLEAMFATWGQPSTTNLPRQRAPLAGGAFNLMGAAYGAKGVHGLKAYAGVQGGQFHTLLYSSLDGRLMAMIEADLFGQMRTGRRAGLRPSCWPMRMRTRSQSSAPASSRARKSPPSAR
jgi:ornithine cyclodeaminase/alanine dehydrogenase-like protein (mu-crystallin family)